MRRPVEGSATVFGRQNMATTEEFLAGQLSGWKQKIVAFAGALGAPGLFLISFLDSSILTFPVINDLLLIELCIQHPVRMPVYAFLAAAGSVMGCVLLYFLARKGGEAFFHRKAGDRAAAIRNWVEKNGFVGMLIAALLPPPTPFKIFVFAAGVFEVPLWSFTAAISLARAIRYFGIGYLAIRYGNDALPFLKEHKLEAAAVVVLSVLISYLISRIVLKGRPSADGTDQ
jgi:membrane protein YqaA with SNARE-associated domain